MLHLARYHVGDGLEAAMRMVGSALGLSCTEFHRPHLVEQQERIEQRHLLVWERPVHNEARALELARRVDDIRHGANLYVSGCHRIDLLALQHNHRVKETPPRQLLEESGNSLRNRKKLKGESSARDLR